MNGQLNLLFMFFLIKISLFIVIAIRYTCAIRAIGKIGGSKALNYLIKQLELELDSGYRNAIIMALGEIGDPLAVMPLLRIMDDIKDNILSKGDSWGVAWPEKTSEVLGKIKDRRALEPLIDHLTLPHGKGFYAAIGLGLLGDSRAVEPLIQFIQKYPKDENDRHVIEALGLIGDKRAVENILLWFINKLGIYKLEEMIEWKKLENIFNDYHKIIKNIFCLAKPDGSYLKISQLNSNSYSKGNQIALENLCNLKTKISSNILNLLSQITDRDYTFSYDETYFTNHYTFDELRQMANEELEERGKPSMTLMLS